ncbi:hypothetical protein C942_02471 [Photobacterium marinum]|uniref:N-acetyltransferase domain-containing protein n=1 Tax=Photobacterium marinum TaxID=1056511 RepID=L8JAF8_9GAMM|nr:GNAT family N-acetyltransferase [Photobacterium marinum]ELR64447.1 hypothetical protein C942_02471 [Photobacterium marinum]
MCFACIAINSESNESVGFALAGEQQGKNVIDLVYVAKGNKGNQIGKSLIQYVEQNYAQQNTFLYVTVCSSQDGRHEKLVSYYHKLGYKRNQATEEFVELAKQI